MDRREVYTMETTCEGKIHLWGPGAKPGDNCACGVATWVVRAADAQTEAQAAEARKAEARKSEGPTKVDEELKKRA